MEPGTHRRNESARGAAAHPWLTTLGAVVAIVGTVLTLVYTRNNSEVTRDQAAQEAADAIGERVIEMGAEHRAREDGFSGDIRVHANRAETLIEEFGAERLGLASTVYRQMAEYVAYSTAELAQAERMAERVLDHPDPAAWDVVRAHWVLGGVAAQRGDRAGVRSEFAAALEQARNMPDGEAHLTGRATDQTRAFRLLAALLGADRAREEPLRSEFCRDAAEWRDALADVRRHFGSSLVQIQVERIVGADQSHRRLPEVCGWSDE